MGYIDRNSDGLCDWCGEPNHDPDICMDVIDKSVDTLKRALVRQRKQNERLRCEKENKL